MWKKNSNFFIYKALELFKLIVIVLKQKKMHRVRPKFDN